MWRPGKCRLPPPPTRVRREGVWRSRGTVSPILKCGTRRRWVARFTHRPLCCQVLRHQHLLSGRLIVSQSWLGRRMTDMSSACRESNGDFSCLPACSSSHSAVRSRIHWRHNYIEYGRHELRNSLKGSSIQGTRRCWRRKTWWRSNLQLRPKLNGRLLSAVLSPVEFPEQFYISLTKQQFVVTHTVRRTEIPASLHSWVPTDTPSVKILCPQ